MQNLIYLNTGGYSGFQVTDVTPVLNTLYLQEKKSILDQLSPRSIRTMSDVSIPDHLWTTAQEIWLEYQSLTLWVYWNKKTKVYCFENRTIMVCYYKSEPTKYGYFKQIVMFH